MEEIGFVVATSATVGECLSCLQFGAITNGIATNILIYSFVEYMYAFLWGICLEVELLSHNIFIVNTVPSNRCSMLYQFVLHQQAMRI